MRGSVSKSSLLEVVRRTERDFRYAGFNRTTYELPSINAFREWVGSTLDPEDQYTPDILMRLIGDIEIDTTRRLVSVGMDLLFNPGSKIPIICAEDIDRAVARVGLRSTREGVPIDRRQDLEALDILKQALIIFEGSFMHMAPTRTPEDVKTLAQVHNTATEMVRLIEETPPERKDGNFYIQIACLSEVIRQQGEKMMVDRPS